MPLIDLNADLGESYGSFVVGRDGELIPLLTSANVACGFHGGDPLTMDSTVRACRSAGVSVGAHPSYPDLVGFGRRVLEVTPEQAESDVLYQVAALDGFCRRHHVILEHVKPHGALYNRANHDRPLAGAIAAAVASYGGGLLLVCQEGTELARAGDEAGVTVAYEGFADRAYNPDGTLVPRSVAGSVYRDIGRAVEQALRMVGEGTVEAMDGTVVPLRVDTLCVHGDNPHAVELVEALRDRLSRAGVELRPMREVVRSRRSPAPR